VRSLTLERHPTGLLILKQLQSEPMNYQRVREWSAFRWAKRLFFAGLIGIAAIVSYAAISQKDGPPADRNVPGATTGRGMASILDR
jgi:hypothetical protein